MWKPAQIVVICCPIERNWTIGWLVHGWNFQNHLICSRIFVFHGSSSMSNGSSWYAKPPPHRSRKLPIVGNGKTKKVHKRLFNQTSGSIVSWKLGGYMPDLEESSFPFLAIAIRELTFEKKNVQQWHSPAKEGPAIVKVAKSKHEDKIACNEAKCIAFICHMAICFHAIWESVLVESKHARHDRKTYHIANVARKRITSCPMSRCPKIWGHELFFVEQLGALVICSLSKHKYTVRAAP